MNWSAGERLYDLLPNVHRVRDGAQGEPLRALLSIIESELETIESDIDRLYDNWFIETCDPWVVPYLGDLIGNRPLHETALPRRAEVAKTIHFRRRKATAPMLAELARDVTGWGAQVVEFFELLAWTQNVNHRRFRFAPNPLPFAGIPHHPQPIPSDGAPPPDRLNPPAVDRVGTLHVRNLDLADRKDGPFDEAAHTIDVRSACVARDRYQVRTVGFFLWRLQIYERQRVTPRPSEVAVEDGVAYGFHLDPLRARTPLFNKPRIDDTATSMQARELTVGGPIRPLHLHHDLERCRTEVAAGTEACASDYLAADRSLFFSPELEPEQLVVMDLDTWKRPPSSVRYRVGAGGDSPPHDTVIPITAGIDPLRGRLAFAPGKEPGDVAANPAVLTVTSFCGFSADLGGGSYRRQESLAATSDGAPPTWTRTISRLDPSAADYAELTAALSDWAALSDTLRENAILTILDNATYTLNVAIELGSDERLLIEAADQFHPVLSIDIGTGPGGELFVKAPSGDPGDGGALTIHGLLIEGALQIEGPLRELNLLHATLVPGRRLDDDGNPVEPAQPSLRVGPGNRRLDIQLDHCISGPLWIPDDVKNLTVRDSIIDALDTVEEAPGTAIAADATAGDGPATTLERVTILGTVRVKQMPLASEVLFTGAVVVERKQTGCVRFSYLAPGSVAPRRYRCQPDLAIAEELERTLDARTQQELRKARAAGEPPDAEAIRDEVQSKIREKVTRRIAPSFTAREYGDPAYAQLRRATPLQIRTGAADGSEMGAFSSLRQPQREANLRQRLDEYLPFGLEAALLFVT